MASVFKPKGSKKYVIIYSDDTGRRRKKIGSTDKTVTQRLARDLENRVMLRKEGVVDAKADALAVHEGRPVSAHLEDWLRDMEAKGKTPKHAQQYIERAGKLVAIARGVPIADLNPGRKAGAQERGARKLAAALKTARLSDLSPERIQSALSSLRDAGRSNQTANHFRAALRAFVRWSLDKGRMRDNPMRGVSGFNVEEDLRHERRSLTPGELGRLLQAAESGPELYGMTGSLRAMAYRVATSTGFRAEELRSLTRESFRLEGPDPSVLLRAASTKNRRPAEQPIPQALARDLVDWLTDKPLGESVFPLHHETAKAIRADLDAAGVPYETDEGIADFHSLRAYFVSALIRAGASIKEVQTLARHAKAQTTLNHYAKATARDLRNAIENLPSHGGMSLEASECVPVRGATKSATKAIADRFNPLMPNMVTSNPQGFAKPLYG